MLAAAAAAVPSIMAPLAGSITSSASAAGLLGGSGILGSLGSMLSSPFGSSALGMLGSFGGGLLSYSTDKKLQKKSYKYALRLQKQQQKWMEQMSNTAHQREVADLRAAGLNPILSATGGSGASVGSASGSPVSAPSGQMFDFDSVVQSAIAAARHQSQSQVDSAQARSLLTDANNQTARLVLDRQRASNDLYATNLNALVELEKLRQNTQNKKDELALNASIARVKSLTDELIAREKNQTDRDIASARLLEERRRFILDERRFMFDKQYRHYVLQLMRGEHVRGWTNTLVSPFVGPGFNPMLHGSRPIGFGN